MSFNLKRLRCSWRSRRLSSLTSQAIAWRERIASGQASNEDFTAWLLKSADHVQVWLELTAFDEMLAQALDAPAGPVVSRSFIPRRRAMLFWPLAAMYGKVRRHSAWWLSATAKMMVVAVVGVIYVAPSHAPRPTSEDSTIVIYDTALQNIADAREYDRTTDRAIAAEYLLSARYECRVRSRTIAALSAHSLPAPDIVQITSVTPFIPPEAIAGRYGREVTLRISRLAEDSSKAAALVLREAMMTGAMQMMSHTPAPRQRVEVLSQYEWELQTLRASTDALCSYLELIAEQDDSRK